MECFLAPQAQRELRPPEDLTLWLDVDDSFLAPQAQRELRPPGNLTLLLDVDDSAFGVAVINLKPAGRLDSNWFPY